MKITIVKKKYFLLKKIQPNNKNFRCEFFKQNQNKK